jgi:hypothetical protein
MESMMEKPRVIEHKRPENGYLFKRRYYLGFKELL